jgi:dihydroorotase
MGRTWIHNANIVNEGRVFNGSLVIDGSRIEQVLLDVSEKPFQPCDNIIDADGAYLLPGIIDEHVHFREPGLTRKADIRFESMAAVAGGVTSIMDMPNTLPPTVTLDTLEQKRALMADRCLTNYACYFGATNDNTHLLSQLDRHHVCGIKVFMGASTGNMLVNSEDALRDIFSVQDMLVATHCESQSVINANLERYRPMMDDDDLPISYHDRIRSPEACLRSTTLAIRLAMELHTHLHILHVSTIAELRYFNSLELSKKNITAEACTGYLLFSSADLKKKGSMIKVNPALKPNSNCDALRHAVVKGKIDTIATDHAPHLFREKLGGALKAASGMPIIQFSLISLLELVSKEIFTLPLLVEKMCHAPALLYKIKDRGFIRPGYKADLVLVKDDNLHIISNTEVLSKCRWTPLNGDKVHWKVMKTFVNGKEVYDGENVDESYRGEELYFR